MFGAFDDDNSLRMTVAGVAVGSLLLVIAARWDDLGEGSQRCRMTG